MNGAVWKQLEREVKAARTRVQTLAKRRMAWYGDDDEPHAANVRELLELRRLVDELIDDETLRARELGTCWSSLGSSRQQAQQRHKRALARRAGSTAVDEMHPPPGAIRQ